jgi:hypothetical protein
VKNQANKFDLFPITTPSRLVKMEQEKPHIDSKRTPHLPLPTPHTRARENGNRKRVVPFVLVSLSLLSLYYQFGPSLYSPRRLPDDRRALHGGYLNRFGVRSESGAFSHDHDKGLLDKFLSIPNPESARKVSQS